MPRHHRGVTIGGRTLAEFDLAGNGIHDEVVATAMCASYIGSKGPCARPIIGSKGACLAHMTLRCASLAHADVAVTDVWLEGNLFRRDASEVMT